MSALSDGEENNVRELTTAEFARRLGLPPGATVTSIGLIWFDVMSGSENNTVRVRYRPGRVPLAVVRELSLEDRLRRLAARWRSQSRHPQRRNQPEVRELLMKHSDDLLRELKEEPTAGTGEKEGEQQ